MGELVGAILGAGPLVTLALVGLLVFAEDAFFLGFVIPGETAAVLGGVVASQGNVPVWSMILLVVLAAIIGDLVGYEIGKHFGPKLLRLKMMDKRRAKLEKANDFLRRRGGSAVFLGRFVAFFRAVMPALAGSSQMRRRQFLLFNAIGGIVWGTGFVLLGYLAGNSYQAVAKLAGQYVAAVIAGLVVLGFILWRLRKARRGTRHLP